MRREDHGSHPECTRTLVVFSHPVADEQRPKAIGDSVYRAVEERVALGIDGVLVQSDRQLDEKIGELARERGNRRLGGVGCRRSRRG